GDLNLTSFIQYLYTQNEVVGVKAEERIIADISDISVDAFTTKNGVVAGAARNRIVAIQCEYLVIAACSG
ncbi:MAG: hypothetical protein AAGJ87_12420, partial [Pseudomonadota bacterium]